MRGRQSVSQLTGCTISTPRPGVPCAGVCRIRTSIPLHNPSQARNLLHEGDQPERHDTCRDEGDGNVVWGTEQDGNGVIISVSQNFDHNRVRDIYTERPGRESLCEDFYS